MTNVFHFRDTNGVVPTPHADIEDAIVSFFNDEGPAAGKVRSFMSEHMDPDDAQLRIYDLDDDKPRAPIYTNEFNLGPFTGGTSLPKEICCALSYRAASVSGEPPARRRGRLYIGPLGQNAGVAASNDFRPAPGFRAVILDAGERLMQLRESDGPVWVVYSPTNEQWYAPIEVSVDDAFDIQRRRGSAATFRSRRNFTTPPIP